MGGMQGGTGRRAGEWATGGGSKTRVGAGVSVATTNATIPRRPPSHAAWPWHAAVQLDARTPPNGGAGAWLTQLFHGLLHRSVAVEPAHIEPHVWPLLGIEIVFPLVPPLLVGKPLAVRRLRPPLPTWRLLPLQRLHSVQQRLLPPLFLLLLPLLLLLFLPPLLLLSPKGLLTRAHVREAGGCQRLLELALAGRELL